MKKNNKIITIDARWINLSGMGTYLSFIIPGLISVMKDYEFVLLGNKYLLERYKKIDPARVNLIEFKSPMYSFDEQVNYNKVIPKNTSLYFSTHYNIPLLYNGPMLVMVYDVCHLALSNFLQGFHKKLYAFFMLKAVRFKAKKIITISQFSKDEIIKYTGENSQPIIPIHLGVDKSHYVTNEPKRIHQKPYILYVGNIKPHKNLTMLIKAFMKIANKFNHDLVLVGKKEGFITSDTESLITSKKLSNRIFFTGFVTKTNLKNYYSNASLMVFPSLYEGFGFPPLEAMASGCPVLVSNVSSMPEICGDSVLYCDPYDINDISIKMDKILKNRKLRENLIHKGKEHVKNINGARQSIKQKISFLI